MLNVLLAAATAALASAQPAVAQAQAPPPPQVQFGPLQQVGVADKRIRQSAPVGAVDAAGRALLVWHESERGRYRIVIAAAPAGGSFGPARRFARGDSPVVGVAPDGRAVIVFSGADGGRIAVGDTTGRFGTPTTLPGRRQPSAVVMAGDGTAAVVSEDFRRGTAVQLVAPDGRPGAPRRLDQNPRGGVLVGEDGSAGFSPPHLAAGAEGTIALLTRGGLLERRAGETTFAHAHRPLRRRAADAQVAVGSGGRIGVTAIDRPLCIFEYGCVGEVVLAERLPGAATFAAPVRAPVARYPKDDGPRVPAGLRPGLAYSASGAPVVTWTEDRRVCTECDLDGRDGPTVARRPGGPRVVLSAEPSAASAVAAGDGVAIGVGTFSYGEVGEAEPASALWFAADSGPVKVAGTAEFPWSAFDLLAGGTTRLLVARGGDRKPVRAALGTITR